MISDIFANNPEGIEAVSPSRQPLGKEYLCFSVDHKIVKFQNNSVCHRDISLICYFFSLMQDLAFGMTYKHKNVCNGEGDFPVCICIRIFFLQSLN